MPASNQIYGQVKQALICSLMTIISGASWAQGSFPTDVQITFDQPGYPDNDVYSPELIYQYANNQQQLILYSGGFYGAQRQDAIYRSVCTSPDACPSPQKVIDPVMAGLQSASLLNDPSIVELNNGDQDYLIMYMTGVNSTDSEAGFTLSNNKIYLATSFASDGVNWSQVELVLDGYWLPSATVDAYGHVILYANSTSNGQVYRFDLGTDGFSPDSGQVVNTPGNIPYSNVNVKYHPELGIFQILGQQNGQGDQNGNHEIDYIESTDGINWSLAASSIVPAGITPAPHPDTACWVYRGNYNIEDPNNPKSNILLKSWC